jgi:hypothetical protein
VTGWRVLLVAGLSAFLPAGAWGQTVPIATTVIVITPSHRLARHRFRPPERRVARHVASCAKSAAGRPSGYNLASGVSFQGRVEKILVRPDRTVLILHDGAGETCAVLPPETELALHGILPDMLTRRAAVQIEGFPDRNDRHKILVEQIEVHPRG